MTTAEPIRSVLICGYGLMGRGVGNTFAAAGFNVSVCSQRAASLSGSRPDIAFLGELPEAPPDLILELVPEDMETKRSVFRRIEARYGDADFLLATGTSGLDLNVLADGLKHPERLIAIHYYMPAESIPIVEVAAGPAAPRAAVDRAAEALERTGKLPLRMYQPVIGFIVNRLQHAILHEAYWMITEGIASAEAIDFAAARMLGPRMCASGLILQKDISGLKVNRDAQRAIVPHLFHNNRPNPLPGALFERGDTGLAAGKGFYDWAGLNPAEVRKTAARELEKLLAFLNTETFPNTARVQPKPRELKA
ncbi:MAG TPA: 3-hydroxyacyl-CoA dehydrogenase NAD-binding domain-containing protein [Burkholderiales bacterium]|nr:3-hydroxyacyl-CoA dehydrogenase NAD-binding domain-containing protein [Burkholderiales bacterium]